MTTTIATPLWKDMRLDEIGRVVSGGTPSTSSPENWDGSIVWVTPADLSGLRTRHLHSTERTLTERGLANSAARMLPARSLVISSRAPIGHMALPLVDFSTNQGCKSIEFFQGQNPDFHFYNLRFHVRRLHDKGEGTTFAEISKTALESVVVPVLECERAQETVASILVKLDSAIEQTETLLAKQQRIRTGLMHDLLTRGLDTKGRLRDPSTHRFKHSALGLIPEDWEVKTFDWFLTGIDAGKSPNSIEQPAGPGEWGVLKVSAVGPDGFVPSENKTLPAGFIINPTWLVQNEDLLIQRSNTFELVGTVCLVDKPPKNLMLCDKTLRLNIDPERGDKRFLLAVLKSANLRRQIEMSATGSSGSMKNIGQKAIRAFVLASPGPDEQKQIAIRIRGTEREYLATSAQLAKLRRLKSGLMRDLLTGEVLVTPLLSNSIS